MRRERETVCPGNEHRKKTTSAQRFNSNYYFISGFLTVIFRMCCASPNHMRHATADVYILGAFVSLRNQMVFECTRTENRADAVILNERAHSRSHWISHIFFFFISATRNTVTRKYNGSAFPHTKSSHYYYLAAIMRHGPDWQRNSHRSHNTHRMRSYTIEFMPHDRLTWMPCFIHGFHSCSSGGGGGNGTPA